jgi:hypothetical protein
MSDFAAIRSISESLRILIETHIVMAGVTVSEESPAQMIENGTNGISVWLYRVTRNEFVRNSPPSRRAINQLERQPFPVDLHYLLSFFMPDIRDEQLLLGGVLQLFHDFPVLRGTDLRGSLTGEDSEYKIHFETLTLEELTRVWNALQQPYRTSISYLVQIIEIESALDPVQIQPVTNRQITSAQIVESTKLSSS